jgi:hypothetical protein
MHRVEELLVCVLANTRLLVRRDIGRVHRSEWKLERKAPRIFLAAGRGVANNTVRRLREIFAAFEETGLSHIGRHARWIAILVIGQCYAFAAGEGHRTRTAHVPNRAERNDGTDNDSADGNSHNHGSHNHDFFSAINRRSIGSRLNATPVAA